MIIASICSGFFPIKGLKTSIVLFFNDDIDSVTLSAITVDKPNSCRNNATISTDMAREGGFNITFPTDRTRLVHAESELSTMSIIPFKRFYSCPPSISSFARPFLQESAIATVDTPTNLAASLRR